MFSCVPGIDSLMAPKLERFLFWDRRTDGQEFLWNSGEALLRSTQLRGRAEQNQQQQYYTIQAP